MKTQFYVGQEVVCVEDANAPFDLNCPANKKGFSGIIAELIGCSCWKEKTRISFGIPLNKNFICNVCGKQICNGINIHSATRFVPVHYLFKSISLTKVLESETSLVGVN